MLEITIHEVIQEMIIQGTDKYLNDLFYVGPLYHEIFTNLEKLIFLDVGKN